MGGQKAQIDQLYRPIGRWGSETDFRRDGSRSVKSTRIFSSLYFACIDLGLLILIPSPCHDGRLWDIAAALGHITLTSCRHIKNCTAIYRAFIAQMVHNLIEKNIKTSWYRVLQLQKYCQLAMAVNNLAHQQDVNQLTCKERA